MIVETKKRRERRRRSRERKRKNKEEEEDRLVLGFYRPASRTGLPQDDEEEEEEKAKRPKTKNKNKQKYPLHKVLLSQVCTVARVSQLSHCQR